MANKLLWFIVFAAGIGTIYYIVNNYSFLDIFSFMFIVCSLVALSISLIYIKRHEHYG